MKYFRRSFCFVVVVIVVAVDDDDDDDDVIVVIGGYCWFCCDVILVVFGLLVCLRVFGRSVSGGCVLSFHRRFLFSVSVISFIFFVPFL